MSNKPANRPGHPRHGNQRRFLRSAKAREKQRVTWYRIQKQLSKNRLRLPEPKHPVVEAAEACGLQVTPWQARIIEKLYDKDGEYVG